MEIHAKSRLVLRAVPALALAALAACADAPTAPRPPGELIVPPIAREFRGMWIATVANIDWPTSAGLSVAQQQAEFTQLLTRAEQTGLNAIILQVRTAGDALYSSPWEPWARSLTGTQGVDPGYDPLAFAVAATHARGMELHAWFNPFRAANLSDTATLAASHLAKLRPDLTRAYCTQLLFDPGEAEVHDRAIAVIKDVATRYDVDGVQIDDYFYPYPHGSCPGLDFPDSATYADYLDGGGVLGRADWRRDNIDRFVERLYTEVHAVRPFVRVGVSPFGIWRPGNPPGIVGLDAYATLYADSRRWLQEGWLDYFAPQLYWSIASTGQGFGSLLTWWGQQNTQARHLWPGLASYRVNDGTASAFSPAEIPSQVQRIRNQVGIAGAATGAILYNGSSVRADRGGFATLLANDLYADGAIPPATTWLDAAPPAEPVVSGGTTATGVTIVLGSDPDAQWWLVRWRDEGVWRQRQVPATQLSVPIAGTAIEGVAVAAIDRVGNASTHAVWRP